MRIDTQQQHQEHLTRKEEIEYYSWKGADASAQPFANLRSLPIAEMIDK